MADQIRLGKGLTFPCQEGPSKAWLEDAKTQLFSQKNPMSTG